jgi:hypothetical protein
VTEKQKVIYDMGNDNFGVKYWWIFLMVFVGLLILLATSL